jgi:anti-sigma factor ChrR (cupin superfamily)
MGTTMPERTEWRIDINKDRFETPMFASKGWQIGPAGTQRVPDPSSPYPYAAYAWLRPGQCAASAAHAGYGLLYVLSGSFVAGGVEYKKGDLCIAEPWSESGRVVAGPQGVEELVIYENGAACIPYFCDKSDPEYRKLREWLDENGVAFPEPAPPRTGFTGKRRKLDLMEGRWKTKWFHSNMFEVGPIGYVGGLPVSDEVRASNRPFFCHAWSDPSLDVPDHGHDGWSFITCLQGRYDYIDGSRLEPGDFLLRSPQYISRNLTRPGPQGVTEIVVFQNGHAITPTIIDPKDPRVPEFRHELHL